MSSQLVFSNGLRVPALGFGTWKLDRQIAPQMIRDVIAAGYRHIDCAEIYGNEAEVGQGLKKAFDEGLVKREDLFITSKLWNSHHRPADIRTALSNTLSNLGLEYVDLYLIHWPVHWLNNSPKITIDTECTMTSVYKELEKLVGEGKIKSLGISNCSSEQTREVYDAATIKPVVNQVESHPMWNQFALEKTLKDCKMILTAYSPLAMNDESAPSLLKSKEVVDIATKHSMTPAQVLLKWHVQLNRMVIPKTASVKRAMENLQSLNFHLDEEDMKTLNTFQPQIRTLNPSGFFGPDNSALFFKD